MTVNNKTYSLSLLEELHTNGAGYDILRYVSLPKILGEEANTLLYFAGRDLARSFEFNSIADIYFTYTKLGWGKLELVKEKNTSLTFHLMADAIVHRLQAPFEAEFRLEAGFLAEAIQSVKNINCECTETVRNRIHQVEFKVFFTE